MTAFQKVPRQLYIARICRYADGAGARRAAPANRMQQTGPRAMVKYGVLATAQLKNALHNMDALAYRARIRKRAEIMMRLIGCAAITGNARNTMRAQLKIRIGFVIPEQNVVARRERFNQIIFKQQGFRLGARD